MSWQREGFNISPSKLPSGQKAEDTHLLLRLIIPVLLWPALPPFRIGFFNTPPWGKQLQVPSPLLCWELVHKPNQFYSKSSGNMKITTAEIWQHYPLPAPDAVGQGAAAAVAFCCSLQQFLSCGGTSNRLPTDIATQAAVPGTV